MLSVARRRLQGLSMREAVPIGSCASPRPPAESEWDPLIPPLIAIPTTAGTGAEVATGSIIADKQRRAKLSVGHGNMAVWVALVDGEMTRGLPPDLTALTGIDALTHGLERYVNRFAVPHTDALALQGVAYVARYLRRAVADGNDMEARQGMLGGSLMASMSRTATGNAHAIAHSVSATYGTPHSVAIAAVLPAVVEFNVPAQPEKMADIARAMGEKTDLLSVTEAADRGAAAVRGLMSDVGIRVSLGSAGIPEADLPELAKAALRDNKGPVVGNATARAALFS